MTDRDEGRTDERPLEEAIHRSRPMTDDTREGRPTCDECGEELHRFSDGYLSGWCCDICGWSWDDDRSPIRAEPSGDVGEDLMSVARWAYEQGLSATDAATLMDKIARLRRIPEAEVVAYVYQRGSQSSALSWHDPRDSDDPRRLRDCRALYAGPQLAGADQRHERGPTRLRRGADQ